MVKESFASDFRIYFLLLFHCRLKMSKCLQQQKARIWQEKKKNVWRYQIFAISQRKFADDITSVYLPLAVKITKLKVCSERKKEKKKREIERKKLESKRGISFTRSF